MANAVAVGTGLNVIGIMVCLQKFADQVASPDAAQGDLIIKGKQCLNLAVGNFSGTQIAGAAAGYKAAAQYDIVLLPPFFKTLFTVKIRHQLADIITAAIVAIGPENFGGRGDFLCVLLQ